MEYARDNPGNVPQDVKDTGQSLENGSLFYGSFISFGEMWFAVTFWSTIGCGIIYLICGMVAAVVSRKFKTSAFVPLFTITYGLVVGVSIGCVASLCIAAMYRTGPFRMHYQIAPVWGLSLAVFHLVSSFGRGILR